MNMDHQKGVFINLDSCVMGYIIGTYGKEV